MTGAEFEAGLAKLGIEASPEQLDRLARYLKQLRKWNAAYNLVASGDLEHLYARHLLDSLSILPFLEKGPLLDLGSGAGLPGLPLAIMQADTHVTLLDSAGKKARFLRHVVRSLGLDRVEVVQQRIECFSPALEFSTITARAFSSLRVFAEAVRHVAGPDTRLLAMKGRYPTEELDDLPDWIAAAPVHRLEVPGLAAERHLVLMSLRPE